MNHFRYNNYRNTIPEKSLERMKKYSEINWKKIDRSALENYLEKLEKTDKLTTKSNIYYNLFQFFLLILVG